MKKLCAIAIFVLIANICPNIAFAYHAEMQEFADSLSSKIDTNAVKAIYDGKNLILEFPADIFSDDEAEILKEVDDMQILSPYLVKAIEEELGKTNLGILAKILKTYNAELIIHINQQVDTTQNIQNKSNNIHLTPEILLNH